MKTNTEILAAVSETATARASELCDAALATLEAGRKTFVKGKPVTVPWSDDKRAQLRALQESAFRKIDSKGEALIVAAVGDAEVDESFELEIVAAYTAAGLAEVARRFA